MGGAEVVGEGLGNAVHSPGPAHDPLLSVSDGGENGSGAVEGLADERVLVGGAVLELVEEYVAVGGAEPCQDERVLLENFGCEGDEVLEGDLRAGDPVVADREPGVERADAGQDGPEPLDQPEAECVEGMAVQAAGQVWGYALAYSCGEVRCRIGLEGDRQDSLRIGAGVCAEEEVGALGEELCLACARSGGNSDVAVLFTAGRLGVRLQGDAGGRYPVLGLHSGSSARLVLAALTRRDMTGGIAASSASLERFDNAVRCWTGLLPLVKIR